VKQHILIAIQKEREFKKIERKEFAKKDRQVKGHNDLTTTTIEKTRMIQ